MAKVIRADRRVLRHFGRRVYWVTLGRDVQTNAAITDKVNDLIKRIAPESPVTFTDPQHAGAHLGALLDTGPRRLMILDDVWREEQLKAFVIGGRRCARLLTTRNPTLVAKGAADAVVRVMVDQFSDKQARALLTWQLPPLPPSLVDALLAETGRWPLLIRLVNKVLADQAKTTGDLTTAAAAVRDRLRQHGALAVDELTGEARRGLDVDDPDKRQRAVRATIEASTGLLDAGARPIHRTCHLRRG